MQTTMIKSSVGIQNKRIYPFLNSYNNSKYLLLLFLPCFIYLVLFKYRPMWGVMIAFKDYKEFIGFAASKWVGLKYFSMFLESPDAFILIRNTFLLGLYNLLWGFPVPIAFAFIFYEIHHARIKKLIQSVSCLPYFLSKVVVVGMAVSFLSPTSGVINGLIEAMGFEPINFMHRADWFRTIYIVSEIWQQFGWTAIIYIAALSNIDLQLYDSSKIDGCNKLQKILYVDLPGILPTIITMFLLNAGKILNIGFEKVLLLYNPAVYETADVISTYVYRQGLVFNNYSYATAINLFQTLISLLFLVGCNTLARKYSETSLW